MQKIYLRVLFLVLCVFSGFNANAVTASFTIDHITGCSPLVVTFSNTSTGATSYSWDLGDGTTTALTSPSKSYALPGTYIITLRAYGDGDSSIVTHTITVNPRPIATMSGGPASICPGSTINFTSTVTAGATGPVAYEWSFGDGGTDTVANPAHTYNLPYGTKNVTLTVTNSLGCDTTITDTSYVNVYTPPVINFTASGTVFCTPPATVTFSNSTTGYGSLTYAWAYGDGGTSTDANPTHNYTASGDYTVRLICTDGHGCSDTFTRPNYIHIGTLNADFHANAPLCDGTPIHFSNTSTDYTFSTWSFDDGGASFDNNPNHTYIAGTYNVTLIVTNGVCYDTIIKTIIVHSNPVAGTINDAHPCPAPSIAHYVTTGYTPGCSVLWQFGDPSADDTVSGTSADHAYLSNGRFEVTAIFTDSNGCSTGNANYDTVFDATLWTNIPAYVCLGTNFQYKDSLLSNLYSHMLYPYAITSITWDFGDSYGSTSPTPTHTYATIGTYVTSCTVTTVNGCTFTITDTTIVTNFHPEATFTVTPDTVCYHSPVTFTAHLVHGPIDGYNWYFNDNPPTFSPIGTTDSSIVHVFNYPGIFDVQLSPYLGGCAGATVKRVVVDSPKAIVGVLYNCSNRRAALFIDSSMGDTWHQWLFPDGTTSTADTITHIFPSLGWDTIRLVTYNSRSGCRDTARRVIQLYDVKPRLKISDSTYCQFFAHTSENAQAVITVDTGHRLIRDSIFVDWTYRGTVLESWGNFGLEIYPDTGLHYVHAISVDERGCLDTTTRPIWVSNPVARFVTHTFCAGAADPFLDSSSYQSFAPIKHYWSYGDGGYDTLTAATTYHYYATGGTFLVTETIIDSFGCTSSTTQATHIWHPEGTVEMLPYPCRNIATHFHLHTYDTIAATSWTFGDGGTASIDTPVHTYTDTGYFHLQLVITDNHGCTDTLRDTIHISVPNAAFLTDTFLVCNPFRDSFINMSTGAATYAWDFGDGNSSVYASPPNTYVSPGIYHAQLIAFSDHGCPDTAFSRIHVFGFIGDFTYPDSGCGPLAVHFDAGLINVDSIVWDYGDATISHGLLVDSITHIYTTIGSHTPRLIIYKDGCTGYSDGDVPVRVDTVYPGFYFPPFACPGVPVTLTDTSTSYFSVVSGWNWYVDGFPWTTVNPTTYTFLTPGPHAISTTATDGWGCSSSSTDTIHIYNNPYIAGIVGDTSLCAGSVTLLTDSTAGGFWYVSDTSIATIDSATGLLTTVHYGTVTVFYNYTSATGCTSEVELDVNVHEVPVLPPLFSKPVVCLHDTTQLLAPVSGGFWGSLDTSIATAGETWFGSYIYGVDTGIGMVTYTVITPFGCSATIADTCIVLPLPNIAPITGGDSICVNSTLLLSDSVSGGVWSPLTGYYASVNDSGLVTGHFQGIQVVTYTVYNSFTDPVIYSCSSTVSDTIHVIGQPVVAPMTGVDTLCTGATAIFTDTTTGGLWISGTPGTVSVDGGGNVTGIAEGTGIINYYVNNMCGTTAVSDTFNVFNAIPPITGMLALCPGVIGILYDSAGPGSWSVADTSIAVIDPVTGAITGVSSGITTVTYTGSNYCGPFTATATVYVTGTVYLTASSLVACQTLPGDTSTQESGYVISGSTECIDVCAHSVIRYYAHGIHGVDFLWTVAGGTIVNNYHDSIDVEWPGAGFTGNITVTVPLSSCAPSASACIHVIERPDASFTMSDTAICSNGTVYFTDGSTAGATNPIVSWNWDFGDGSHSVVPDPAHAYDAEGYYTVTLTVRNACNCADTQQQVIHILTDKGPSIVCPSVSCSGETMTYYTDNECEEYDWTVIGGTITSGSGTSTITVLWDAVGPDGYGYVSLNEPCMPCVTSNTIRIPVIPTSATISGPAVICKGESYIYSLPLIGGTQYHWGVLGHPEAIAGYHDDHTVVLNFANTGTYAIHGWYQNRLRLCGADVTRKITVVDATLIHGSKSVCVNAPATYSLPGGLLEGDWTIADIGGTVIASGYGNNISYTFTSAGSYQVSVTGDFCADPVTVNVSDAPVIVDSIKGVDTVCLNRPYTYIAHHAAGNAYIQWRVTGGNVMPQSGSDTVMVVWTNGGYKQLAANMTNVAAPYCTGLAFTLPIEQEAVTLHVTGDTTPCANSVRNYTAGYNRGEVYDWSILPDTLGSVVGGLHLDNMRVQWNNIAAPRTARIIVAVRKCDSAFNDTLLVHVQPNAPVLTVDSALCPGMPVTFTASAGGSSYLWHFGDGTSVTTATNTTDHAYPHSASVSGQSYAVTVHVIADPLADCPVAGIATFTAHSLPEPFTRIYSPEYAFCDTPMTLTSAVAAGAGTTTLQWYKDGVAVGGGTGTTYTATDTGRFMLIATGANGCFDTSNIIHLKYNCNDTTPGSGNTPCDTVHAFYTVHCNTIHVWCDSTAPHTSQIWIINYHDGAADTFATDVNSADVTVPEVGQYMITYQTTTLPGACIASDAIYPVVQLVPSFTYDIRCASGVDSVILADNSLYEPGVTPLNYYWYTSTDYGATWVPCGTGLTDRIALPPGSFYLIQHELFYMNDTIATYCFDQTSVTTPPTLPAVGFTATSSPICTGVPISFDPLDSTGIAGYRWDFGDSSSSLLMHTQRAYTNEGGGAVTHNVTLKITDTIGCTADSILIVTIFPNGLRGGLGAHLEVICSNEPPVTIGYIPISGSTMPTHYLWSSGAITPTITVNQSGNYWLTVSDDLQCQQTVPIPTKDVRIIKTPHAHITGRVNYCAAEPVVLNGDAGSGYTYQWMQDGAMTYITTPTYSTVFLSGNHTFRLVISAYDSLTGFTCMDTSALFTVHVFDTAQPPAITDISVLDCSNWQLQLKAEDVSPGTFNWSNGVWGDIDTVYAGGRYTVWFTDTNGCTSSADTVLPAAPELGMQYFPTGCYTICKDLLPVTLYGPPHTIYSYWAWIKTPDYLLDGLDSEMEPFDIDVSGTYQWHLEQEHCALISDNLDVTADACEECRAKVISANALCSDDPAAYTVNMGIDGASGVSYSIGSNIGPMSPFTGTLPGGYVMMSFTFTTLELPPPGSMFVYITFINADGGKCIKKVHINLPACEWIDEKPGTSSDTPATHAATMQIASAMMVYPNPASGQITISYDYGSGSYVERSLAIFDNMGRAKQSTQLMDGHGNWSVDTRDWTPGIYIIRMEADGKTMQTQRIVISN